MANERMIESDMLFLIDSPVQYALDNLDGWIANLNRSPRMYPPRGGDIVALWEEFVALLDAGGISYAEANVSDFATWLKTQISPEARIAAKRIQAAPKGKLVQDDRQRLMQERLARIKQAREEIQLPAEMPAQQAVSDADAKIAADRERRGFDPNTDDPRLANRQARMAPLPSKAEMDEAFAKERAEVQLAEQRPGIPDAIDQPNIPSHVIAPEDAEDPLAGL